MPFAPQENPEYQVTGITPDALLEMLQELEKYNLRCAQGRKYDQYEVEIPIKYRGIRKYWWPKDFQEVTDEKGLITHVLPIYDNDPEFDNKILLIRYQIQDEDGTPMQTLAAAEKHIRAARLESERQEMMAQKNPALNEAPKIILPEFHRPEDARQILDAKLNPTSANIANPPRPI
jgi:hypothetical protein